MKFRNIAMGSLLSSLGLFCATSSVADTSNFELNVLYESGVRLEFFGFNSSGEQIFSARSTDHATNHGIQYWISWIDEDLVFDGDFAVFCVRDRRGRWSVPATLGKEAKELICDYNPTDAGDGKIIFLVH